MGGHGFKTARTLQLLLLVLAALLSIASIWDTGSRTATIGGLVEDCCGCLAQADCLPDGATEETCNSEYDPVQAMTNQLEIHIGRAGCDAACPDCSELREDYSVSFTTETVRHASGES